MSRSKHVSLLGLWILLLLAGGCSGSREGEGDRPPVYPVTGVVTQGGQPVAGATVQFRLEDDSRGAVGVTDAEGRYSLTTFEPGDGCVAGNYKVSILKYDQPAVAPTASSSSGEDSSEANSDVDGPAHLDNVEAPPPKNLLPAQYADPAKSGLTATVKADEENEFTFELK